MRSVAVAAAVRAWSVAMLALLILPPSMRVKWIQLPKNAIPDGQEGWVV